MTKKGNKKGAIVLIAILLVMIVTLSIIFIKNKKGGNNIGQEEQQEQQQQEKQKEPEQQELAEKYVEKLQDGTKLNNSNDFKKNKKYKELEISNIQFTSKDGNSVLLANIENKGNTEHKMEIIKLVIIGENGEIIETLKPVINDVGPGQTVEFNAIATADLVNAKDFRIEEMK